MTISTAPTPLSYSGNGSTTAFPITYKYNAKSHIVATLRSSAGVETVWVLTTNYTLTDPGDTGTLTALVAPATGTTLLITLEPPNTQSSDIPIGGDLPSTTLEDGLDLAAQRDAKIEALFLRALRVPKTDTQTGSLLEIPIDSLRASKFLGFDANGKPIAAVGTSANLGPVTAFINTLLDDTTDAVARTTLNAASLAGNTFTGVQTISASQPEIQLTETGVAADNGRWKFYADAEGLRLTAINDADSVAGSILVVERTGTTIDSVTLGGTTVAVTNALTVGLDATINGIEIGRGGGSVASNTTMGDTALDSNTTGSNNTAFGKNALTANIIGANNTAVGNFALAASIGSNNTAIGNGTLPNNGTGSENTAIGAGGLNVNTTGSGNTAISPRDAAGFYSPVFNPTTENNRFCMGSTGVTNAYIQVSWTVVSDARDKRDISDVPHGLDFVSQLKPVSYRFKMSREDDTPNGPLRYGFLAQDILALEGPNSVIIDSEDAEKLRMVDQHLIAVMVKAIQELRAEFHEYKAAHP